MHPKNLNRNWALRNAAYYRTENPMSASQADYYASGALIRLLKYNVYRGINDDEVIDPRTGKLNPAASELKWTDDWNRDVFRNGVRQEYNLSIAGGTEKTQVYLSASYLNDEGYVPNSGFDRITVRAKVDQTIYRWLKAGLNFSYSNTVQQTYGGGSSSTYNNLFFFGQTIAPIYPIYRYNLETGEKQYAANGDPEYDWGENRAFGQLSNPYGQLMTSKNKTINDNLTTRGYIDVQIRKDLKFTVNLAYDLFNTKSDVFQTPAGGDAQTVNGRGSQSMSRYTALNTNQLLTWSPTFGDQWLQDYIYMRASEMYLIEAESLIHLGKQSEAQAVLAEFAVTRNPAWNQDATLEEVHLQRRIELWGEGLSYYARRRNSEACIRSYEGTNHNMEFLNIIVDVPAHHKYWLFQIPQRELQENIYITEKDQNPL